MLIILKIKVVSHVALGRGAKRQTLHFKGQTSNNLWLKLQWTFFKPMFNLAFDVSKGEYGQLQKY